MLASSASLTQLTVTTTPYKAQPLRPPLLSFDGYAGELLVSHHASSRMPLPAHATRPYCPEALFLFFSGKLSLPLCARLIAQHQEDQPEAVSEAKTSFHRAKKADSFTYHRLQVDLPAPTIPDPASSSHTSPGYASLPAAALGVRPRLASERSRTPREQPLTQYSARQYDHDFPPFTNAIGAPPSTHKGKGKGKLSDRPPLHIPGKNKGKGKFTPKGPRKDPRKAPTKAPRKDPSKVLEKEQARAKAKAKEKERATNNSCTRRFPSHCNGITPLRMAAAPPYRCTRLPSLPRYNNPRLLHTRHWQLHHLGAPAWLPFHTSWIRYFGNTSGGFTI